MKLYDISQEVFGCKVFPGDPSPERKVMMSISSGDICNLTEFSMCAHNGTHVDAPYHFIDSGATIDQVPLEKFVGYAYVAEHSGDISASDITSIISSAGDAKMILIKGPATLTSEAASVVASSGIVLFGNESQTVGPEDAPAEVHNILLGASVVLLEGIRLSSVPAGTYLLSAAPLNLGGADGAPCRAILMEI